MSLLESENICGKSLLQLVSSGSAIIAELLRIAGAVPGVFEGKEERYDAVCFDFGYLKEAEDYENRVNSGLLELDTEFLETHSEFAKRSYVLFESMIKYWRDVDSFLERLEKGYFIRHSLDNVLEDTDGKQLLGEALFLYGVMLALMEAKIPGRVREKLVIACYRSEPRLEYIDDVCKLVRSTEGSKKRLYRGIAPLEILLSRFLTERTSKAAKAMIAHLATDDVYLTNAAFPSPEMTTTRLAGQAALLCIILYLSPDILKSEEATMRQVVDRHFNDNWIIHIYMGHTVDLTEEWADPNRPYTAARLAIANVLTPYQVERLGRSNAIAVHEATKKLDAFLTEGQLSEQLLLDHMRSLLDCCRTANAALRWRLLHGEISDTITLPRNLDTKKTTTTTSKEQPHKAKSIRLASGTDAITLLLKASQLEYRLKQMFQSLLDSKNEKWSFCKAQVVERMRELSDYFTGEKALARVRRDDNLMKWFSQLAKETESLSENEGHATVMGRKIQTLIGALEEVEQFEQVDTNLQIKAFLADTREFLSQMIRITNVQQSVMTILETISDASYAWAILKKYISILHDRVRAEPLSTVLLRATFLKLASILDVPLVRISQCNSPDAVSVAEYYSSELVKFVREVLDVIPVSVFRVLENIVEIQTHKLAPLPVKFETLYLKDYAQLQERYALAKLTNQVSVFTEGVLAMEKTLLGVVRVEPRRILHDGLRKELLRQLATAMHKTLIFPELVTMESYKAQVLTILDNLAARVDGYRRSVEYVQDYIDMAGLKMWQEEVSRLIQYAVEQESNKYLRRKILDEHSSFQSTVVPIPRAIVVTPSKKNNTLTFMGRTLQALLVLTAPEVTTYSVSGCAWYWYEMTAEDKKKRKVLQTNQFVRVCGVDTLDTVERSLGVVGLAGLDRLLAFRVVHALSAACRDFKLGSKPMAAFLEHLERDALDPEWLPPGSSNSSSEIAKFYAALTKKLEPLALRLGSTLVSVGHAQLLRKAITHALSLRSRLDASHLNSALQALDTSLLSDFMAYYQDPQTTPYPLDDEANKHILPELSKLLDASGLSDPFEAIYMSTEPLSGLSAVLLVLVLIAAARLHYSPQLSTLLMLNKTAKENQNKIHLDGFVLVVGVHTLLKQFHPAYTHQLLAYLGQFLCSSLSGLGAVSSTSKQAPSEIPPELSKVAWFIDTFCRVAQLPPPNDYVPPDILRALRPPATLSS